MGSARRLLAAGLAAVVLVVVGFGLGYAAATTFPETDRSERTEPARVRTFPETVGDQPDYLAAAADVARVVYAVLVEHQQARDAAAEPLRAIGWTPETCEVPVDGIPLLGARPVCEPIIPSVGHWHAINRCEQGGDWHAYGRFGNGLMGGGGLGISDGAWRDWGGTQFAANAAGASPYAQMIVASRGYARYGGSPWECKA